MFGFSRAQKYVTSSAYEAEYAGLEDAVNKLLLLRQIWCIMLPGKGIPCFLVFEDDHGAVQLAQNSATNSKFQAH